MPAPDHDILIVGAGISGISMAAHLQRMCPERSYSIVERRERPGGTWDLFRYPGVRSDSDMHTLGFSFEPWRGEKAIAEGAEILAYLDRTIAARDIGDRIRCSCRVVSADRRGAEALWHVTLEDAEGRRTETARFLYLASGYYDHDEPHDAHIDGLDAFAGEVIHPQFWPQDLDYSGRKVVVIGSGATAVTIVPAMAEKAAHVTLLQRTPTWMFAQPSTNKWARRMRKLLPEKAAYKLTRFINTRLHAAMFKRARSKPGKVAAYLTRAMRGHLGDAWSREHFTPPYDPWVQRLCLVPDADLFEALKQQRAAIVTGRIAQIEQRGVRLEDGRLVEAEIIVTATGLRLTLGGKIAVSVDGERVDWPQRWFYRNCMFSNLPNLAVVFGYLNAGWTLRADMTARFTCRVLNEMERRGAQIAVPVREEDLPERAVSPTFGFSSGYIARAAGQMPRSEAILPWRLNMDYLEDIRDYRKRPIGDGVLAFSSPGARQAEAVE